MWMVDVVADLIGPARAVRNVATVLEQRRTALAEIDSVVDRLQAPGSARMLRDMPAA